MLLRSIETTPNPNSMKLNLSGSAGGKAATYSRARPAGCGPLVAKLLEIAGVESVFVCSDFVTLNRDPRADWEPIIASARSALAGEAAPSAGAGATASSIPSVPAPGEVKVSVQTFREVPIQVKASDGRAEKRIALDPRFGDVARQIQARTGGDYLKERSWVDKGVRYGSVEEVAATVAEEIDALLDDDALARILADATGGERPATATSATPASLARDLASDDWRRRLRAVKQLGTDPASIPLLRRALADPRPETRRWAAAGLGATGSAEAVSALCEALGDASVAVRRTAGDGLSDLGDPSAQPAIIASLTDANKLVRWRAARFLAEVGTVEALPALELAAHDPEFEVRGEVEAALARIRGGAPGAVPVWKRMSGPSSSPGAAEVLVSPTEFLRSYESRTAAHDLEGTLALVADDAVFLFSNQSSHLGKAAIREALRTNFEAIKAESYAIRDLSWLVATDEVAVGVYEYHWSGQINGQPASGRGRGTTVIRRVGGAWRVAHEHLSAGRLRAPTSGSS